ncbi:hypothetical protein ACP4OV_009507 [Aristida adscensionis]
MMKRKRGSNEKLNGPLEKKGRSRLSPSLQLSDLPMDILYSIVSRLPIREAVRTSILSKHWKYVWCCRPNLMFTFRSMVYKEGSKVPRPRYSISEHIFIQRVNAVLEQHTGYGVKKMEVHFSPLNMEHKDHIDRWVRFAIASKTSQLVLDLQVQRSTKEPYNFSFQLFDAISASHLQSLKLCSLSLNQPANIKVLVNLKKLELVDVNITDDELNKLVLSSCNVLEFIGISRCKLVTSLHAPHHLNHLKHLRVSHCPLLQRIQLNFSPTTLEYEGSLIPLAPHRTMRNLTIRSMDIFSALGYIFTKLPSTLPDLEMLTLGCQELKRAALPNKLLTFVYLRHLRLELSFVSLRKRRTTDVLDLARFLETTPIMEKLEVHMRMGSGLKRYHKGDGELRSLPPHPHSHLKLVNITGFYGQKDQLELALHILRNSTVLKTMKIDPRPIREAIIGVIGSDDSVGCLDGYKVAKKYLRKADHRGLVDIRVSRRDVEIGRHDYLNHELLNPSWLE